MQDNEMEQQDMGYKNKITLKKMDRYCKGVKKN